MIGIVKSGKYNNNNSKINIFTQTTEPTIKEGIWVQTDKTFNEVSITNSLYREKIEFPNDMIQQKENFGCVKINNKIYCISGHGAQTSGGGGPSAWYYYNHTDIYDISTNTWSRGTDLPNSDGGLSNFGCVAIDNKIYCIAGYYYSSYYYKNELWIYDTSTDTWSRQADMPLEGRINIACIAVDTKIYCIGGEGNGTSEVFSDLCIYDTTNNTWSTGSPAPSAQPFYNYINIDTKIMCFYYSSLYVYDIPTNTWSTISLPKSVAKAKCINYNNEIYLFNNDTSVGTLVTSVYNISTNTFIEKELMPIGIKNYGCVNIGDKVYCVGGYSNSNYSNKIYIYDLTKDKWIYHGDTATTKYNFGCIVKNDKVYNIGGNSPTNVDIYDFLTQTWSTGTSVPGPLDRFGAALVGDKIYCIGGYSSSSFYKNVRIYDITNNTWAEGTQIPITLLDFGCVSVNSKIYCIGGRNGTSTAVLTTVHIYDTITDTWSMGADMPIQRTNFYPVAIGTNIYCMNGGVSNSQVDMYDTTINIWSTIGNMSSVKSDMNAVAVNDKIYCIGGHTITDTNVEIFDTITKTWSMWYPLTRHRNDAGCVLYNDKIYIFYGKSGSGYTTSIDAIELYFDIKKPPEKSLMLLRSFKNIGKYYTQLFNMKLSPFADANTRFLTSFDDVWIYENGQYLELPTYYGDGTKWIKFKN